MSGENSLKARDAYKQLLESLDLIGLSYNRNDEEMYAYSAMQGKSVPVEFSFSIDEKSLTLDFVSPIRLEKSDKTRFDVAIAVGIVNSFFVDGFFDYGIETGDLYWRNSQFVEGTVISKELVKSMLFTSFNTVDSFYDKFAALSKGDITVDGFLRGMNG